MKWKRIGMLALGASAATYGGYRVYQGLTAKTKAEQDLGMIRVTGGLGMAPRCIDDRRALVYMAWNQDLGWRVVKRGEAAEKEQQPQFLGASLMFVRALQQVANLSLEQAIFQTELAHGAQGYQCQIHLDDHSGQYHLPAMHPKQLEEFVLLNRSGCGFASYAWGDEAAEVLTKVMLQQRWRVQILTGKHRKGCGATLNYAPGMTLDTHRLAKLGISRYNLDVWAARMMFRTLEKQIAKAGFARQAEDWMINTFMDVVVVLGGVNSPREVVKIR